MYKSFVFLVLMTVASWAKAQDWYVGLSVSKSVSTSENIWFSDSYKGYPGGNVVVGNNFNRFLGARLMFGFNPQRGRACSNGENPAGTSAAYSFNSITGYGDVLLDVTELFRQKSNHRRSSLYLIAGGGVMHTLMFDSNVRQSYWLKYYNGVCTKGGWYGVAHAGLAGNIVLTQQLTLNVEAKYNFISDKWNGVSHDNRAYDSNDVSGKGLCSKFHNGYIDISLGVNWYFEKKVAKAPKESVEAFRTRDYVQPSRKTTWELQSPVVTVPEKSAKETKKPAKEVKTPKVPVAVTYAVGQRLSTGVSFYFDYTDLCVEQKQNVKEVAEYLKANPDKSLIIHGYADKDYSGEYKEHNEKLASDRAQVVYNSLINDYGISSGHLKMMAHPSSVAGYKQDGEWIRAVEFEVAE